MFGEKQHYIGLDISPTAVRAVQVKSGNGDLLVTGIGVTPLNQGVITEGRVVKPELLTQAIKEAVREGKFKGTKAFFAAGCQNLVIRYVKLPTMTEVEVREALKWEMAKNVPFTGKAVYDFQVLNNASGEMEVMLVAAEEKEIEEYCACVKEAGLLPAAVDIGPLALARLMGYIQGTGMFKSFEGVTFILVDMGEDVTGVSFFTDKKLSLYRAVPVGSRDLRLSSEESPGIIEEMGLDQDITALEKLLNELGRSMKFFQMQNREADIAGVLLTGGAVQVEKVAPSISEELNLECQILNPFVKIQTIPELESVKEKYGRSLALGLGLAIREGQA